jgi:Right handed beta helix region
VSYLARWRRWPARRSFTTTVVAVAATFGVVMPTAVASTAEARVAVASLEPTAVSLLATGFPQGSTVRFRMSGAGCPGEEKAVVVEKATFPVEFATAAPCSGIAVVTATSDLQSASTTFVAGDPAAAEKPSTPPATVPPPAPPKTEEPSAEADASAAGLKPVTSTCTVQADGADVPDVQPGDTVCFSGTLPKRLQIRKGGTPDKPITYSGQGTATVPGITARTSHIVLEGFVSKGADDNGVYVSGNDITIRSNDISGVRITDDDVDAIRFFGDHITIAHNYAHDIWANPQKNRKPHTDCMQTYAHSEPASSNILIEGNRCTSSQFRQCIMAEGPRDFEDGASGIGRSANWLVKGNYFECHAPAQTVALQDIHDVTFTKNDFQGTGSKAIALQKDATGAVVEPDNTKGPGYKRLVELDHKSARQGYRGPGG